MEQHKDSFASIQEQYEKNKRAAGGNKFPSQEERMKKYFTTVLPKGSAGEERRVRILPTKDGASPFVEVYFHEVQVDGKWVKLYDPKQEGKRSPLNEVKENLEATGIESDKELSKSYRSRKFYIVKVIDRDHEQDGPKFWRFKHNSKQEGILDKIFPIFRNKGDITDPVKGRDLILSLSLTKSGTGKEYTSINSIIPEDPGPLNANAEIADAWINDSLVWSDVYSKKPEDYLDMVANGETPKWDSNSNKWVSNSTAESTIDGNTSSNTSAAVVNDPQANEDPSDEEDLPF
jgi:hypothetical protein